MLLRLYQSSLRKGEAPAAPREGVGVAAVAVVVRELGRACVGGRDLDAFRLVSCIFEFMCSLNRLRASSYLASSLACSLTTTCFWMTAIFSGLGVCSALCGRELCARSLSKIAWALAEGGRFEVSVSLSPALG